MSPNEIELSAYYILILGSIVNIIGRPYVDHLSVITC